MLVADGELRIQSAGRRGVRQFDHLSKFNHWVVDDEWLSVDSNNVVVIGQLASVEVLIFCQMRLRRINLDQFVLSIARDFSVQDTTVRHVG